MEMRLGRTLHENFPVIDKIPNGIATSIKSIDLRAATYQNMATLINRLSKYVGEVSEFVGGELGEDVVEFSDIKGRAVEVAIPKGTMGRSSGKSLKQCDPGPKRSEIRLNL